MPEPVDMDRIRADHAQAFAEIEDHLWERYGHTRYGASFRQGVRWAIPAAIEWLLTQQHAIDDLTVPELIEELRKREGSIYWAVKAADPTFHADCPTCGYRTLTDAEGLCRDCGYDHTEN